MIFCIVKFKYKYIQIKKNERKIYTRIILKLFSQKITVIRLDFLIFQFIVVRLNLKK